MPFYALWYPRMKKGTKVRKVRKGTRDKETERQSEVSAEIIFIRQVAMSHCPIVSKFDTLSPFCLFNFF